ncbi:MAG: M28 family peptidase [Candidatus Sulfotelmatobacter sp.]
MLCSASAILFPLLAACSSLLAQAQTSILGFTPSSTAHEAEIETKFKTIPSPDEERRQHHIFTAEPHVAGSARNNELARYIADEWRQEGLEDVVIRRYDVYGSNPKFTSFEMVAPVHYRAVLREMPVPGDPDLKNKSISAAWSGMSASGEVTAPLVYAHSGNPDDYDLLRRQGIDVKGKVVLVRYSNPYSYRGFKALTAEREGAAAILIYSDPAEDGFKKGKVVPNGPWGPEYHIQRGAITYDFMVPGDPLTPGWASVTGAKRIPVDEAVSIPKIMALPLSWHDAKPLLANMDGPLAPEDWQGGLPIKYHLGGKRVRVHVKIEMDNTTQPYYVVEGRIRGAQLPDEWIVLGNHRDAWVFGGVDPSSGTASMMELTRALGKLAKAGTRPRRTIVVCSWDGEEVGLTGSTEWGEQFADELRKKAVAYINVDEATSGPNFSWPGRCIARSHAARNHAHTAGPFRQNFVRGVEGILHARAHRGPAIRSSQRFESGRYPHRQRLRPHCFSQLRRYARSRPGLRRSVRRLPFCLRRFFLDESLRRSRLPLSHADDTAVGRARPAPRQR